MSRSLLRSVLELRSPLTRLQPAFLLPTRTFSSITTTQAEAQTSIPASSEAIPSPRPRVTAQHLKPEPPSLAVASESISQLLPLLRAQPRHYITAHIHGRPYLVTEGDQIRLPFKMPGVLPGDVLRLDRASVLGSRDYTLKGSPWIESSLFECRATVLGTESEPMRVKIKTKRRNRRSQRVTSKHKYTILRISELKLLNPTA
jgi:large subunit ribosomal protein L21